MSSQLFIPTKLKVGYQNRADTFTGKLAYVIYYDEKGKLRKEKSWTGWCDSSIPSDEFDNKPTTGFVIHKGQQRFADWFGTGRTMIRIHHPDGFEFEITVNNLMNILMHSDVSKRDIVQECVFAWGGTELVLLPTNSIEYLESVAHTKKQDLVVSTKSLVPGVMYSQKKSTTPLMYVGFYEYFDEYYKYNNGENTHGLSCKGKKHVFYDPQSKYFSTPSTSTLASALSDDVSTDLPDIIEKFFASYHAYPANSIVMSGTVQLQDMRQGLQNARTHYEKNGRIHTWDHYLRVFGPMEDGLIGVVTLYYQIDNERVYDETTRQYVLSDIGPDALVLNPENFYVGVIRSVENKPRDKLWMHDRVRLERGYYTYQRSEFVENIYKSFEKLRKDLEAVPKKMRNPRQGGNIVQLSDLFAVLSAHGFTSTEIQLTNEIGTKLDIIRRLV